MPVGVSSVPVPASVAGTIELLVYGDDVPVEFSLDRAQYKTLRIFRYGLQLEASIQDVKQDPSQKIDNTTWPKSFDLETSLGGLIQDMNRDPTQNSLASQTGLVDLQHNTDDGMLRLGGLRFPRWHDGAEIHFSAPMFAYTSFGHLLCQH